MATKQIVTLVCDSCGRDVDVTGHLVKIDRREVLLDFCDKCWDRTTGKLRALMMKGRKRAA